MNIFKTLKRGNSREEEYFSAALAILLDEIPELTTYLLDEILGISDDLEEYEIILEYPVLDGRVDIAIKSIHFEIFIENKISADLDDSQLERYSKHLESIDKATKLILLTRDFTKDETIQKYTDNHIFWTELYTLIELFTNSISDNIKLEKDRKKYLLKQFLEFLREENMSDETVSWEYSKGAVSLINLLKTIQRTLDRLIGENKIIRRGTLGFGFEFTGYYFQKYNQNEDEFWIGIVFNDTNKLFLELLDGFCKKCDDTKFEMLDLSPDNHPTYKYNFGTKHFLAFSRVEQDIAIYNFINDSLDDINKIIK